MLALEIHLFWKKWLLKRLLLRSCCTEETIETMSWCFKLSFRWWDISRVQLYKLNIWWKAYSLWSAGSLKKKTNFIYSTKNFFQAWSGIKFISQKFAFKETVAVVLHLGNCPDCQMAFQTEHFGDGTYRRSNWSLTEQLVKGSYQ